MKILVNRCFGGFGFSDEFKKFIDEKMPEVDLEDVDDLDLNERENEKLIALVEAFGLEKASGEYADLDIVELPDETTDYYINEYDGSEDVIYVVDGKIFFA